MLAVMSGGLLPMTRVRIGTLVLVPGPRNANLLSWRNSALMMCVC